VKVVRTPSVSLKRWNGGLGGKDGAKFSIVSSPHYEAAWNNISALARMKELCSSVEVKGRVDKWTLELGVEVVRDPAFAGIGLEG
jgi:hypothetical protein